MLPDVCKLAISRKKDNDVTIFWHDVIVKFFDLASFLLSSLVTSPSFMSISWLVLELWQFSFIKDWPKIQKSKISSSEFCPRSRDWGTKFGTNISNKMLLSAAKYQGYCFYHFWAIKGKPTERRVKSPPTHTQIRLHKSATKSKIQVRTTLLPFTLKNISQYFAVYQNKA